jgi:hypothetical protein
MLLGHAGIFFFTPVADAEFDPVPYALMESAGTTTHGAVFHQGDLDADGKPDVIAYYRGRGLSWCRTLGVSGLEFKPVSSPQLLVTLELKNLRIVDLDGDGYPDVLASRSRYPSNDEIFWLRNRCGDLGHVEFESVPRQISTAFFQVEALHAADMDGDGHTDVVSVRTLSTAEFHIHRHTGAKVDPLFAAPVMLFDRGRYPTNNTLAFGDLDEDGDLDVTTTLMMSGGVTSIQWLENLIINPSHHSLDLLSNISFSSQLPTSASAPKVVLALIGNELWIRYLAPSAATVTYRESEYPEMADEFQQLKQTLAPHWLSAPDAFKSLMIRRRISAMLRHPSGVGLDFTEHPLYSTLLPGSIQYYSPNQYLLGDLDGDGDLDLFTGYNGSYGPMTGWFENRLDEAEHADIAPFIKLNFEGYDRSVGLYDLDGNGRLDLVYQDYYNLRAFYDFRGARSSSTPWSELIVRRAAAQYGPSMLGNHIPLDLDGDGDLDLVGGITNFFGAYLAISENHAKEGDESRFERHANYLVANLPLYNNYTQLRVSDKNADGAPDVSLGGAFTYRNALMNAPKFGFIADATLGSFPTPPAANATVSTGFDQWLGGRDWQRIDRQFARVLADLDGDGDDDVVLLHGPFDVEAGLSWFENLGGSPLEFRGPLGISGDIDDGALIACADYDSDGDVDVLALTYRVVQGGNYRNVVAFENQTTRSAWLDSVTDDREGFLRHAIGSPNFTAALQLSDDMDWANAMEVGLTAEHLRNAAAMKHFMQWLDPGYPKRFYRLRYSLD